MRFNLFKKNPQAEARQLSRDASAIVDMVRSTYRDSLLAEIARLTRAGIAQMADLAGEDWVRCERELDRYKVLHREARRQNNQGRLTAYTLIIIHTRSLKLGELGAPAREVIEGFLDAWPGAEPPEGTLEG
jgi:hypothetical protein